jgi:hypothetical protein
VAADERFQTATGTDSVELMGVADHDRLGTSDVDGGEELEHRLVVGHACLVDEHHGPSVEVQGPVFEAPDERRDGAAVDAGLLVQSPCCLSADGGAAVRAQYPLLAAMVIFTVGGLFLLLGG